MVLFSIPPLQSLHKPTHPANFPTNALTVPLKASLKHTHELCAQSLNQPLVESCHHTLKIDKFNQFLRGYDRQEVQFLINGFKSGFPIHFEGNINPLVCDNLKSAKDNPSVLKAKILEEVAKGRIAGPFATPPIPNLHFSSVGLVPKRDGKFRLIHHLSFPNESSVNDGIPEVYRQVSYQTLDQAISLIQKLGRGALIAKADIKDAFRLLPVREEDHHLLGLSINGVIFYDKYLPTGISSACQTFERFSSAIHWLLEHKYKVEHCVHILDDFMFFATMGICNRALDLLLSFSEVINLSIKHSKTILPTTVTTLFGIKVDTVLGEVRLPIDKFEKLKCLISSACACEKLQVKEFQSLLGHLNFACLVVIPGRASMHRLYNLLCKLPNPKPHHWLRLGREAKADLEAWNVLINSHFLGLS